VNADMIIGLVCAVPFLILLAFMLYHREGWCECGKRMLGGAQLPGAIYRCECGKRYRFEAGYDGGGWYEIW